MAERALRGVAVGRKNWLFAGSEDGGKRAATIYSLIGTRKLLGIEPFAYLRDVLERLPTHPASRIEELTLGAGWQRAPRAECQPIEPWASPAAGVLRRTVTDEPRRRGGVAGRPLSSPLRGGHNPSRIQLVASRGPRKSRGRGGRKLR